MKAAWPMMLGLVAILALVVVSVQAADKEETLKGTVTCANISNDLETSWKLLGNKYMKAQVTPYLTSLPKNSLGEGSLKIATPTLSLLYFMN